MRMKGRKKKEKKRIVTGGEREREEDEEKSKTDISYKKCESESVICKKGSVNFTPLIKLLFGASMLSLLPLINSWSLLFLSHLNRKPIQ